MEKLINILSNLEKEIVFSTLNTQQYSDVQNKINEIKKIIK